MSYSQLSAKWEQKEKERNILSVEAAFGHSKWHKYTSKYFKVIFVWCYMLQHATMWAQKVCGPPILFAQSLAHGLAVLGLHGPHHWDMEVIGWLKSHWTWDCHPCSKKSYQQPCKYATWVSMYVSIALSVFSAKFYMGVSKNRGVYPPKSSILIRFSIMFTIHFGGKKLKKKTSFGLTPIWTL